MKREDVFNFMRIDFFIMVVITFGAFVINSFTLWEIYNPFQWIVELPNYTIGERENVLGIIASVKFLTFVISFVGAVTIKEAREKAIKHLKGE